MFLKVTLYDRYVEGKLKKSLEVAKLGILEEIRGISKRLEKTETPVAQPMSESKKERSGGKAI